MGQIKVQELRGRLESYFRAAEESRQIPTMSGVCLAVGCSPRQLLEESEKRTETGWELMRARLRVCDQVERLADPMSVLKVKQPIYCGYADKGAAPSAASSVTLRLEGECSAWDAGG